MADVTYWAVRRVSPHATTARPMSLEDAESGDWTIVATIMDPPIHHDVARAISKIELDLMVNQGVELYA